MCLAITDIDLEGLFKEVDDKDGELNLQEFKQFV